MQSIGVLIFVILVGLLVYMCIGGNKVKVRRSGNSITVITKDRTVEYNYLEVIESHYVFNTDTMDYDVELTVVHNGSVSKLRFKFPNGYLSLLRVVLENPDTL
jgi:hypothetical protein